MDKWGVPLDERFLQCSGFTKESEKRVSGWFQGAGLGIFLHFGLYSLLEGSYHGAGEEHPYSEWIQCAAKIPAREYRQLANKFYPHRFDAAEWCRTFKQAGASYVVFTAKHHDGFAMYDSRVSDFNIVEATDYGVDILAELRDACSLFGLRFGIYYSHVQDWHHPDAWILGKAKVQDFFPELPDDYEPNMDNYIQEKALPQVVELMENYRPDLMWFDTPSIITTDQAKLFSDTVRKMDPDCIINSRVVTEPRNSPDPETIRFYDYVSLRDKEIPETPLSVLFETPDSISSSYAYKTKGRCIYHSLDKIKDRMAKVLHAGGNYLLNSGPMPNGKLDPVAVSYYQALGDFSNMERV